tara:strand:- start:322 stop:513 length:192 start_codon:yes stop_codon:yes gene_type:complete
MHEKFTVPHADLRGMGKPTKKVDYPLYMEEGYKGEPIPEVAREIAVCEKAHRSLESGGKTKGY